MKLDEIREVLRALSPADLRAVLAEFAEAFSDDAEKTAETEKPATAPLEIATIVIADRQELLRRLAQP